MPHEDSFNRVNESLAFKNEEPLEEIKTDLFPDTRGGRKKLVQQVELPNIMSGLGLDGFDSPPDDEEEDLDKQLLELNEYPDGNDAK
mmetsp:Transcript_26510/g.35453  ORF Transcript_26510/g.35453 Transcript_26510/m.35453 type:complete len:87 (+) Transcript_26510:1343-1603(+)